MPAAPRRSRAGCVPVLRDSEGTVVSVLLVTSGQYQGKYILPAGKVEDSDLRADDAALRSATPSCATTLFIKCSGAHA
jgi:8-oxo-dGTP pyrophosphatase MutT (NUDIX family)